MAWNNKGHFLSHGTCLTQLRPFTVVVLDTCKITWGPVLCQQRCLHPPSCDTTISTRGFQVCCHWRRKHDLCCSCLEATYVSACISLLLQWNFRKQVVFQSVDFFFKFLENNYFHSVLNIHKFNNCGWAILSSHSECHLKTLRGWGRAILSIFERRTGNTEEY